ncbi:MAG: LysM peptidoglycan-binding domain-containing protein, partial [Desulfomonilia bacterium]
IIELEEKTPEITTEEMDVPYAITFDIKPQVDYWSGRFSNSDRRYFQQSLRRFDTVRPLMETIFEQHDLPKDLVYLCLVESGGNPHAVSRAGATGYWQFMPGTARIYGLTMNRWVDERRDLEKSTVAAALYLKHLHSIFDDWLLAIAAYNAGEGTIHRIMKKHDNVQTFWDISHEMPIKSETLDYVPKFIATLIMAKNREEYGLMMPSDTMNPLQYDVVKIDAFVYLDEVAEALGVSEDSIVQLNPELIRGCTPPLKKRYGLKVPENTSEKLTSYLEKVSDPRDTYIQHTISQGDTLSHLAKKYNTSSRMIARINRMSVGDILHLGRVLIIPYGTTRSTVPSKHTHTVAKGETLKSISKRYGIEIQDLVEMNRIEDPDTIYPDMVLSIPPKGQPRSSFLARSTQYRVKKGDTLWGISKQFEVSTGDIIRWNQLRPTAQIYPGDKLTIYHR